MNAAKACSSSLLESSLLALSLDLYVCPAVRKPTNGQLKDIAHDLGFHYEDEDIQNYKEIIGESIESINNAERLMEPRLPTKYPRLPGYRPNQQENPYNAWYWKCEIQGSRCGKLAGKRIAIKDNVAVAGVPMMNGCFALEGYTPDFDATVVNRILEEGGFIAGKTTCENLCLSGSSYTAAKGPVFNPHDTTISCGGSSSGSAVAVLVGDVDMAIGSDQGGSVRLPAAWTGIVGLKPTYGLVPYTGAWSLEPSVDHLGPMARTVRDCATLLEVIAGYDNGNDHRQCKHIQVHEYVKELEGSNISGISIGILEEGLSNPKADPGLCGVVESVVNQLSSLGASIKRISIPLHSKATDIWNCLSEGIYETTVRHGGVGSGHNGFYPSGFINECAKMIKSRPNDISDQTKLTLMKAEYLKRNYDGRVYAKGRNLTITLREAYDKSLEEVNIIAMPTIPFTPTKLLTKDDSLPEYHRRASEVNINTHPFNLTGHPALSVNAGYLRKLPVGLMLVGRHYDEITIFKVAQAVEKIRDETATKNGFLMT
ncbi:amidase-like isoform X2 [Lytechinus variegatus]|uniref:amidase-like isoform X2 n=1 Tax=Lytechinus variegatus TaxID=7654 RepID=UPI001BB13A64|nr:amidase-like isoform X2 [Lytechinus variegatus]